MTTISNFNKWNSSCINNDMIISYISDFQKSFMLSIISHMAHIDQPLISIVLMRLEMLYKIIKCRVLRLYSWQILINALLKIFYSISIWEIYPFPFFGQCRIYILRHIL